ncbi:MAG: serine acetyltransferase [Flavobacteriales bacterium]|nr:serine acetyltransferase [Flavobacteriales bacterium]MCA0392229.1 serine O-acetyltransferase [Bacteroidota bacterium]
MKNFLEHLQDGYANRKYDLDKKKIENFIDDFFRFVFFLELQRCASELEMEKRLHQFKNEFTEILHSVFDDENKAKESAEYFFRKFPEIYKTLEKDAEFALKNDPAATSVEEITFSYPGFYAVAIYRLAHELQLKKIPVIPRIWTELAHSKTGIDIHPGANIGSPFFIDHGTGIVIGETSDIGNSVILYQGVTLGALSVSKDIANTKRHPTIENNVVIYANATVLGGETRIGENSIIGGNVWITESLPKNSVVFHKGKVTVRNKFPGDEPINYFI